MRGNLARLYCGLSMAWFSQVAGAIAQDEANVGTPLTELPDQVNFDTGKVSIFADFPNAGSLNNSFPIVPSRSKWMEKMRKVRIFVINDSQADLQLPHQNDDIYLKQEVLQNGNWVRSQYHNDEGGNARNKIKVLPPKRFCTIIMLLDSAEENEEEPRKVRYRFYGESRQKDDLAPVSNTGKAHVFGPWIEIAKIDDLSIREADLPELIELATVPNPSFNGRIGRKGALFRLREFPANNQAVAAVKEVATEAAKTELYENDIRARNEVARHQSISLSVYVRIAPAEEAFRFLQEIVTGIYPPNYELEAEAFKKISEDIIGLEDERRKLFEQFLADPEHRLYAAALSAWAESSLASDEDKRRRLTGWYSDDARSPEARYRALATYRTTFPNPLFETHVHSEKNSKKFRVIIDNISNRTIRFSYKSPLDIVEFIFADPNYLPLPLAELPEGIQRGSNDQVNKIVLEENESLVISNLNPWPIVKWSDVKPLTAGLYVFIKIPELGDDGSLSGSWWLGFDPPQESESVVAMFDQPLISPESKTFVAKRDPVFGGFVEEPE